MRICLRQYIAGSERNYLSTVPMARPNDDIAAPIRLRIVTLPYTLNLAVSPDLYGTLAGGGTFTAWSGRASISRHTSAQ